MMTLPTLMTALLLTTAWPVAIQEADSIPLFRSHDVLELTLEADFDALDDDRSQETEDRPATLRWTAPDGTSRLQEMQVKTRGKFRLKPSTCPFPPLRLNFKKDAVTGTVFAGQDKIKLVTHCRDRDDYEQNVMKEYLAYRIYNVLTEMSMQVRLARITYVDTSGDSEPVTRLAFLLENDEALAARVGGTLMEVPQADPGNFADRAAVRLSVFQYLLGNTDWSMAYFHNVKLVRTSDGRYVPVPYDFDWSGLVDARYAQPDPSLPIDDVRERIYRGFCRPGVDFGEVLAEFMDARPRIYELVREQEGLEEDTRKDALQFLAGFFEVLGSERRARREIGEACRRL